MKEIEYNNNNIITYLVYYKNFRDIEILINTEYQDKKAEREKRKEKTHKVTKAEREIIARLKDIEIYGELMGAYNEKKYNALRDYLRKLQSK